MKSYRNLFILLGVIVIVFMMAFSTIYLYSRFAYQSQDDWFKDPVDQMVIDYLKGKEQIDGKIQVYKYMYTNYDRHIAEENRKTGDKKYPFEAITVIAETSDQEYTVYLFVDENGVLQIDRYEKRSHFNPFL